MLKRKQLPDAVFCYNDLAAVGKIHSLLANNPRVPEDVAVIGCGNLILSPYLEVPLSSIDQSPQQQEEEAANLALSLIARTAKSISRHLLVQPKLILRKSTLEDVYQSGMEVLSPHSRRAEPRVARSLR
jgi:LacI family transcriptional regulator